MYAIVFFSSSSGGRGDCCPAGSPGEGMPSQEVKSAFRSAMTCLPLIRHFLDESLQHLVIYSNMQYSSIIFTVSLKVFVL